MELFDINYLFGNKTRKLVSRIINLLYTSNSYFYVQLGKSKKGENMKGFQNLEIIVRLKLRNLQDNFEFKKACETCQFIADSQLNTYQKTLYLNRLSRLLENLSYNPQDSREYWKCNGGCKL